LIDDFLDLLFAEVPRVILVRQLPQTAEVLTVVNVRADILQPQPICQKPPEITSDGLTDGSMKRRIADGLCSYLHLIVHILRHLRNVARVDIARGTNKAPAFEAEPTKDEFRPKVSSQCVPVCQAPIN
jgi:hypothetical protein